MIVTSPKLSPALSATIEAMRRGGISVTRGGRVLVRGAAPAVPERVDRIQAVYAAIEARDRETAGNLTLHDFATSAALFGAWPRANADRFVVTLVNQWVAMARANPTNPHAFVPAFLAQMASRQSPPVDLARPFKPSAVRITELEWFLLLTAFERDVLIKRSRLPSSATDALDIPKKPCSEFNKVLEEMGYVNEKVIPFSGAVSNQALKHLLQEALKGAIDKWARGDKDFSKFVQSSLKYAKILLRVHSLYLFFKNSNIEIKPQDNLVHKGVGRTVPFKMFAFAGLTDAAEKELAESGYNSSPIVRALRDCAKTAGIPIPEDIQDMAESMKGWRVRWSDFGRNSLAMPNRERSKFKYPGSWMDELTKKVSDTERYSVLEIDIQDENKNWHRPNDPDYVLIKDPWYATAELESSQPPDITKLKSIITKTAGGIDPDGDFWKKLDYGTALVDAITDILANWARTFVKPTDTGFVMVEQHVPCFTGRSLQVSSGAHRRVARQTGVPTCGVPSYTGVLEGKATHKSPTGQVQRTDTARATVVLEPVSLAFYPAVRYRAKSGTVNLEVKGTEAGCTFSGQASHALSPARGVELKVTFSKPLRYFGFGTSEMAIPVTWSGPGSCPAFGTVTEEWLGGNWWSTIDERTSADRRSLRGSATEIEPEATNHFTWNLRAVD